MMTNLLATSSGTQLCLETKFLYKSQPTQLRTFKLAKNIPTWFYRVPQSNFEANRLKGF